jgi:hypothetical protein
MAIIHNKHDKQTTTEWLRTNMRNKHYGSAKCFDTCLTERAAWIVKQLRLVLDQRLDPWNFPLDLEK